MEECEMDFKNGFWRNVRRGEEAKNGLYWVKRGPEARPGPGQLVQVRQEAEGPPPRG